MARISRAWPAWADAAAAVDSAVRTEREPLQRDRETGGRRSCHAFILTLFFGLQWHSLQMTNYRFPNGTSQYFVPKWNTV